MNNRYKKTCFKKTALYSCIHLAVVAGSVGYASAQSDQMIEEVVVSGQIVYRDRTESVSPELQYGLDFFQQYEPTSVGDMLKRTPGITFGSDIGEYDAPQMRGLGNGYTQVLINGRAVPGSSADRAVFVDRIPAEMVERIEIIRSPSADQDSQGIGGTINIVLKDGASFDGGSFRVGGYAFTEDGEFRGSAGFAYGGQSNDLTWAINANWQERYVAKIKTEQLFDLDGNEYYFEQEDDVRNTEDISVGGSISYQLSPRSSLTLDANHIITNRDENQIEQVYDTEDGERILDEVVWQDERIKERTTSVGLLFEQELSHRTSWDLVLRASQLTRSDDVQEYEGDTLADVRDDLVELEFIDAKDRELVFATSITHAFSDRLEVKTGIDLSQKNREETIEVFEVDDGEVELDEFQAYEVQEDRADFYVSAKMPIGDRGYLQLGTRVETTERTLEGDTFDTVKTSRTNVNPSAHVSYDLTSDYTLRASIAKTLRRPSFVELSPVRIDHSRRGSITGNPHLKDESAWGVDAGFERSFAQGILGVNVFYRTVEDLIERRIASRPGTRLVDVTFENSSHTGKTWGVEMDLSAPLTDNIGLFANYTAMDSEIIDDFTGEKRRFNDQASYVYNFGLTQTFPSINATAGFSYQKRGGSSRVDMHRVVDLSYDANLELFGEIALRNDYVLRLTVNNLLDAKKYEDGRYFDGNRAPAEDILERHRANAPDYYEWEVEEASPVIMLTLRGTF